MILKDRYDCRNCGAILTYNKIKTKQRDYGGVALFDRVCPHCGSVEISKFTDRLILWKYVYPAWYADFQDEWR